MFSKGFLGLLQPRKFHNPPFTTPNDDIASYQQSIETKTEDNIQYEPEFKILSTPSTSPDYIIIGAGPAGLYFSLLLKQHFPHVTILFFERYQEYVRTQKLRLDVTKLKHDAIQETLLEMVINKEIRQHGNLAHVPVQKLESDWKTKALNTPGIQVNYELFNSFEQLNRFPNYKNLIAADGAKSKVRNMLYKRINPFAEDDDIVNHDLQYIIQLRYLVKGKTSKLNIVEKFKTEIMLLKSVCDEDEPSYNPITDQSQVSLRFFVDEKIYNEVPKATDKEKLMLNEAALPLDLKRNINSWLNVREFVANEEYIENSAHLNKITLSNYRSKIFITGLENHVSFLIGDAAMGLPFYKALNTHIMSINLLISLLEQPHLAKNHVLVDTFFNEYIAMMDKMFSQQVQKTKVINLQINVSKSYFNFLSHIPNRMHFYFARWRSKDRKSFEETEHVAFKTPAVEFKEEGFNEVDRMLVQLQASLPPKQMSISQFIPRFPQFWNRRPILTTQQTSQENEPQSMNINTLNN